MKNLLIIISLLFCFSYGIVFAGDQDNRLNDLVNQLKGKSCSCEIRMGNCVKRKPFASFSRRHDKEHCIVDAAKALGMMESRAQGAVPALLEALRMYRNVETGDGIIPVRSAIAEALGKIGDPRAIKPLIEVLVSDDQVKLLASASVLPGYKPAQGTSYGAVVSALGMFGPDAKEALPVLRDLLAKEGPYQKDADRAVIEEAIKEIDR